MKKQKTVIIFSILFILIILGGYFGIRYAKKQEGNEMLEYTPEQEITEEQSRQTIVSLYFIEKETGDIYPEARLIDIKELLQLPYDKLMELLIQGPKNDKLTRAIPENTKLNKAYTEGDCLVLDVSADIISNVIDEKITKEKMIDTIVNTMTELTEINQVKFLVDGQPNEALEGVYVRKVLETHK